ncbi:hypothetical protein NEOC84_001446|nr:hypothetical protein [Neochlamydia sp. AcF95]NGY95525.1 hypothetical protein [Neochlamydia sp. AcF84]
MSFQDKILLIKRFIIEIVNDQLKGIHLSSIKGIRSGGNSLANMLAGIAAYSHQSKKPSLRFDV